MGQKYNYLVTEEVAQENHTIFSNRSASVFLEAAPEKSAPCDAKLAFPIKKPQRQVNQKKKSPKEKKKVMRMASNFDVISAVKHKRVPKTGLGSPTSTYALSSMSVNLNRAVSKSRLGLGTVLLHVDRKTKVQSARTTPGPDAHGFLH